MFEKFCNENLVLPLTATSCNVAAELYALTREKGTPVDDIDLLIAGIALENELALVTNNEKHFGRIPNLKIENWIL